MDAISNSARNVLLIVLTSISACGTGILALVSKPSNPSTGYQRERKLVRGELRWINYVYAYATDKSLSNVFVLADFDVLIHT